MSRRRSHVRLCHTSERDVGAPLISLNAPTERRSVTRKVASVVSPNRRRAGTGIRRFPADATFHLLEIGVQAIQLSPYHAGPSAPRSFAWTRPLISWHALVPSAFRHRVSHRTQEPPFSSSQLSWGYNRAPHGALKRVVDDVFASPFDVDDPARRRSPHLPHRRRRLGRQHQKHPRVDVVRGQILLGDAMLALTGLAKDHWHVVGRTPGLEPPGEPPGQPHQVGVVQLGVAVAVPAPPPHPEPARVMPERKERVEHDPIHAVIATGHQIRITKAELVVGHPLNLTTRPRAVKLPEGPPLPGEVPAAA